MINDQRFDHYAGYAADSLFESIGSLYTTNSSMADNSFPDI